MQPRQGINCKLEKEQPTRQKTKMVRLVRRNEGNNREKKEDKQSGQKWTNYGYSTSSDIEISN